MPLTCKSIKLASGVALACPLCGFVNHAKSLLLDIGLGVAVYKPCKIAWNGNWPHAGVLRTVQNRTRLPYEAQAAVERRSFDAQAALERLAAA